MTMRRPDLRGEDGASLILVMGISFVLLIVVTTVAQSSLHGFRGSVRDQRWHSALAAADAGVEDYLYRLNQDGNYWRWTADDPPPDGNSALTGEAPVSGAPNPATFSYEPDTSDLVGQGVVGLRSTGSVGDQSRTVDVTLRRRGFLDYLYFTDLETKDPALYPNSGSRDRDWAQANCTRYAWATPSRHGDCVEIEFYEGGGITDRIRGRLHTNDRMRVKGEVEFLGDTSSSYPLASDDGTPACPPERFVDTGGGTPVFANACDPAYDSVLTLPPNNQQIKVEADHTLGKPGCLFTGPTKIQLDGNRMRVDSPFTKVGNCRGDTPGVWQSLPSNGVVYVQGVPGNGSDPNYSSGCRRGHPFDDELANGHVTEDDYGCRDGDVFLWGELDGQLTIAAENNINLVWNTTVEDLAVDDVLGLVADNYVQVYHPRGYVRWRGDWYLVDVGPQFHDPDNDRVWADVHIHAAILSVRHSFTVGRYDEGNPLGTLHVTGAIAQKYRGPVGTSYGGRPNTGYEKDYVYDDRLRYLSPPHFLDPVDSAWRVATWAED